MLNNAKSYTDHQVSKVGAASAALAGLHYLDYNQMINGPLLLSLVTINTPPLDCYQLRLSMANENSIVPRWCYRWWVKGCLTSVLLSSGRTKIRHSKQAALKWQNKSKTYKLIMHHCADNEELRAEVNELNSVEKITININRHVLVDIVY